MKVPLLRSNRCLVKSFGLLLSGVFWLQALEASIFPSHPFTLTLASLNPSGSLSIELILFSVLYRSGKVTLSDQIPAAPPPLVGPSPKSSFRERAEFESAAIGLWIHLPLAHAGRGRKTPAVPLM